ncbi:MarR family winged helix-turn-helix transcriptional regulator [Rhodococcus globerulus]|uniref:MarR family winged helix-turn-helix transcriptional regulator n=1 Tax=Rhodococcus globerulus TaxID=33008 RepID=UPI000A5E0D65|nr:MarR family winged helix-turn-helix transcriptional regulator [Rhodococcus globerulus]
MSVQPDTAQALVDTVFLFGRSLRSVVTHSAESVLPPALVSVLFMLAAKGECRQNELAVDLCVSQSSLSRQMSDLVDAGYVERSPDPADKRAFRIRVSDEGHSVLEETKQRRAARLRGMLEDWSQEEAVAAVASLQRLNETFGAALHRQASPAVPHPALPVAGVETIGR